MKHGEGDAGIFPEVLSRQPIGSKSKRADQPETETINWIENHVGSITSIVGPTGSGKSRLLGDIEWLAQGDTPTGRSILINDATPDTNLRFSLEHKLVAQLSQNMKAVGLEKRSNLL